MAANNEFEHIVSKLKAFHAEPAPADWEAISKRLEKPGRRRWLLWPMLIAAGLACGYGIWKWNGTKPETTADTKIIVKEQTQPTQLNNDRNQNREEIQIEPGVVGEPKEPASARSKPADADNANTASSLPKAGADEVPKNNSTLKPSYKRERTGNQTLQTEVNKTAKLTQPGTDDLKTGRNKSANNSMGESKTAHDTITALLSSVANKTGTTEGTMLNAAGLAQPDTIAHSMAGTEHNAGEKATLLPEQEKKKNTHDGLSLLKLNNMDSIPASAKPLFKKVKAWMLFANIGQSRVANSLSVSANKAMLVANFDQQGNVSNNRVITSASSQWQTAYGGGASRRIQLRPRLAFNIGLGYNYLHFKQAVSYYSDTTAVSGGFANSGVVKTDTKLHAASISGQLQVGILKKQEHQVGFMFGASPVYIFKANRIRNSQTFSTPQNRTVTESRLKGDSSLHRFQPAVSTGVFWQHKIGKQTALLQPAFNYSLRPYAPNSELHVFQWQLQYFIQFK